MASSWDYVDDSPSVTTPRTKSSWDYMPPDRGRSPNGSRLTAPWGTTYGADSCVSYVKDYLKNTYGYSVAGPIRKMPTAKNIKRTGYKPGDVIELSPVGGYKVSHWVVVNPDGETVSEFQSKIDKATGKHVPIGIRNNRTIADLRASGRQFKSIRRAAYIKPMREVAKAEQFGREQGGRKGFYKAAAAEVVPTVTELWKLPSRAAGTVLAGVSTAATPHGAELDIPQPIRNAIDALPINEGYKEQLLSFITPLTADEFFQLGSLAATGEIAPLLKTAAAQKGLVGKAAKAALKASVATEATTPWMKPAVRATKGAGRFAVAAPVVGAPAMIGQNLTVGEYARQALAQTPSNLGLGLAFEVPRLLKGREAEAVPEMTREQVEARAAQALNEQGFGTPATEAMAAKAEPPIPPVPPGEIPTVPPAGGVPVSKPELPVEGAKAEAKTYYHVVPDEYRGGDLVSLQARIRQGELDPLELTSRWPEYEDYLNSPDAERVALYESLADAEYHTKRYGGRVLEVDIPSDEPLRLNQEGYPTISSVPASWIRERPSPAPAAPAKPAEPVARHGWEMTPDEYHEWRASNGHTNRAENDAIHRAQVEAALSGRAGTINVDEGGVPVIREDYTGAIGVDPYKRTANVPPNVLADYPDLAAKYATTPTEAASVTKEPPVPQERATAPTEQGQGVVEATVHPNLIEYTVLQLKKSKSLDAAVRSVVNKFNGAENMFLGGKVSVTAEQLTDAVLERAASTAIKNATKMKPGMGRYALEGMAQQFKVGEDALADAIRKHPDYTPNDNGLLAPPTPTPKIRTAKPKGTGAQAPATAEAAPAVEAAGTAAETGGAGGVETPKPTTPEPTTLTGLDAREADVLKRIADLQNRPKPEAFTKKPGQRGATLSPEELLLYAELGAVKIAKGAVQFAEWSAEMAKHGVAFTTAQMRRIHAKAMQLHAQQQDASTGISRARIEAARQGQGLPQVPVAEWRAKDAMYAQAKADIDSGKLPIDARAAHVMDNPGNASALDLAGFKYRLDQVAEAVKTAKGNDLQTLLDKQDMLQHAARRGGREWAETGHALQLTEAAEDLGNIASVLQLARDNKGKTLTLPEIERIKELQQKYTDLLASYQKLQNTKPPQSRAVKRPSDFGGLKSFLSEAERVSLEAAEQRLLQKANRLHSGVDPTIVADLAEIIYAYTKAGGRFSYAILQTHLKKEYKVSSEDVQAAYEQAMNDTRLAEAKTRAGTRLEELQAGKLPQRPPTVLADRELIQLREKVAEARRTLMEQISPSFSMLRARQMAAGILNAPTGWLAAFDDSFLGRQGLKMVAHQPKAWGAGAKTSIQAMQSEGMALMIDDAIMGNDKFPLAQRSGLAHTSLEADKPLATAEEVAMYMRAFGSIPIIGKATRPFERAYTTAANVMRHEAFYRMADAVGDTWTAADFKGYADFLNKLTGRGNLGRLAAMQPELNALFISPRKVAGDIQVLFTPLSSKATPAVRRVAAKTLVTYAGALASLAFIANASGVASVGLDPGNRGTFLKLRIGDTRFDLTGGLSQVLATAWAMGLATYRQSRWAKKKPGPFEPNVTDVVLRYFRGKVAPGVRFEENLRTGKDYAGKPITPWGAVKELITPWNAADIVSAWREENPLMGLTVGASSFLGIGAQTYKDKPRKTSAMPAQPSTRAGRRLDKVKGVPRIRSFTGGFGR